MSIIGFLEQRYHRWLVQRLRRRGAKIAADCRIIGKPSFGSEPYLVEIGRHVTISSDCMLITHDGATWVFRDQPRYQHVISYGAIRILDNCFIGARSTILPGVTIGPNAIVGAASLVNKDVPPGVVVAGNPARVICTVEEYAEKQLARTPAYSVPEYQRDKQRVVEELYLRR